MTSILHFADLHLDSSFEGIGFPSEVARRYREALREALVRIIDIAIEKNVDVITMGGDLYEQERFTRDTGEFLREQFRRAAPIKIFISPGNHDPWMPDSLYQYLEWPHNVSIFQTTEFSQVSIKSGITLWGMAHPTFSYHKNPLADFQVSGNGINILLFHGADISKVPNGKRAHAPFRLEHLEATGADMALMGHYHRGRYGKIGEVNHIYPGSPEPLGFGESTGEHSAALIEISEGAVAVERVAVSRHKFRQAKVDITGCSTRELVKNRIEACVEETADQQTFLRIELAGQVETGIELDLNILQEFTGPGCGHIQLIDHTLPSFDLERIGEEKTVRGQFVRKIQSLMKDAEEEKKKKLMKAMFCGLNAFEGQHAFLLSDQMELENRNDS